MFFFGSNGRRVAVKTATTITTLRQMLLLYWSHFVVLFALAEVHLKHGEEQVEGEERSPQHEDDEKQVSEDG